jgi:GMP synthase-like glutamine amidotransferase
MKPVLVLQHLPDDSPAFLSTWLAAQGLPFDLRHTSAGDPFPAHIEGYGALAVLGGEWSANDDRPSLRQAELLIRQAVAAGVPVLGHCLGGQLMSRALGGSVAPTRVPERGWHVVELATAPAAGEWFGTAPALTLFQWHGDAFTVPPGAVCLATSAHCAHQAFALGPHLAMQFHVEVDAAKLGAWADEADATMPGPRDALQSWHGGGRMRQDSLRCLAASQEVAARVYARWMRFAR